MSRVIKSYNHKPSVETNDVVIKLNSIVVKRTNDDEVHKEQDEAVSIKVDELLEKARTEAEEIKKEAEYFAQQQREQLEQEKQEMLSQMEIAAEQVKEQAFEKGYEEGLNNGFQSWETKLSEVKGIVDQLRNDYYKVIEEANPQMICLAIKTAEKIIGKKLEESPENWISMVKNLVKEAREFDEVKLYVSPKWYEQTLLEREELKNMLHVTSTLFIYPDENLEENGAVIEFPFGKIDATLDVQLKEIKDKLIEQIEVSKG